MTGQHVLFDWIAAALEACGAEMVDMAILQPADPFLDIVGEDLRRRIFMTENENGDSLCLRPEFTIPVAMKHIADKHQTPTRYGYLGEVFRQRRDGASAFYQAGIEDLGEMNIAAADAKSLHDAYAILNDIAAFDDFCVVLGDQAVFEAVLKALGLPKGWQRKLLRSFGDDQHLHSLLQDLVTPKPEKPLEPALEALITKGDEKALMSRLEEEMFIANISPAAGRTPQEIAHRLIEKHALSRVALDAKALSALQNFLGIDVTLDRAEESLHHFAQEAGIEMDHVMADFQKRNQALKDFGLALDAIRYDAAFGRPLDYYTGLVYEIRTGDQVLVGGGRYDRLLTMLGASQTIPAVGFSIWLDRIQNRKEKGSTMKGGKK